MSDKYQDIKDREYARLALIHAEMDRKHKRILRRIYFCGVIFAILLLYFCFFR